MKKFESEGARLTPRNGNSHVTEANARWLHRVLEMYAQRPVAMSEAWGHPAGLRGEAMRRMNKRQRLPAPQELGAVRMYMTDAERDEAAPFVIVLVVVVLLTIAFAGTCS